MGFCRQRVSKIGFDFPVLLKKSKKLLMARKSQLFRYQQVRAPGSILSLNMKIHFFNTLKGSIIFRMIWRKFKDDILQLTGLKGSLSSAPWSVRFVSQQIMGLSGRSVIVFF